MARVTRGEVIALVAALIAVVLSARGLRWAIDKGDPRRSLVREIHATATPARDIVIVTDDSPDLIEALAPLATVQGSPVLQDLTGLRRLFVLAPSEGPLAPYEARLGAPTATLASNAVRWDLAGLRNVRFDLLTGLLDHTRARRDGGPHGGPCVRDVDKLRCHSPDAWNHIFVSPHPMNGVQVSCVFAHPQAQSQLVIEVPELPAARYLVGIVGMDDGAYFPTGSPVTNHIRFAPSGGGRVIETDVVAPSKRGTTPYRIDLGGRPGSLSFSISTPNAGARQYCFTALATD